MCYFKEVISSFVFVGPSSNQRGRYTLSGATHQLGTQVTIRAFTNLSAALGSPSPSSSEAAAPEPGCLRSSSGRSCCRRWPCRTPGSAGLRRRCGARRSSGGPAGRPAAGSHPADGSERSTDNRRIQEE